MYESYLGFLRIHKNCGKKSTCENGWRCRQTGTKSGTNISIGFYFPNDAGTKPLGEYAMSVDDLEAFTHMDFFVNLDTSIQARADSTFSLREWKIKQLQQCFIEELVFIIQ